MSSASSTGTNARMLASSSRLHNFKSSDKLTQSHAELCEMQGLPMRRRRSARYQDSHMMRAHHHRQGNPADRKTRRAMVKRRDRRSTETLGSFAPEQSTTDTIRVTITIPLPELLENQRLQLSDIQRCLGELSTAVDRTHLANERPNTCVYVIPNRLLCRGHRRTRPRMRRCFSRSTHRKMRQSSNNEISPYKRRPSTRPCHPAAR